MLYVALVLLLAAAGSIVAGLITADVLWAWLSVAVSVAAALVMLVEWLRHRKRATAAEPEAVAAKPRETDAVEGEVAGELPVAEASKATESSEVTEAAEATKATRATGSSGTTGVTESTGTTESTEVSGVTKSAKSTESTKTTESTKSTEPTEFTEPTESPVTTEQVPIAVLPAAGGAGQPTQPEDDEPEPDTEGVAAGDLGDPGEEDTDAADLLVVADLQVEVLVVDEYPRYHLADCSWLVDRETIPLAVAEARDLGFTPCDRCGPDAQLAAEHREAQKKKPLNKAEK